MSCTETIFVALLGEGTDVWRPVKASSLGDRRFVVNGPLPDNEQWEFEPGSLVLCETPLFRDGTEALVATTRLCA